MPADTAAFAAMADPVRNRQFRRPWTGPPKTKGPAAEATADQPDLFNTSTISNTARRTDRQARLVAVANGLFAPPRTSGAI